MTLSICIRLFSAALPICPAVATDHERGDVSLESNDIGWRSPVGRTISIDHRSLLVNTCLPHTSHTPQIAGLAAMRRLIRSASCHCDRFDAPIVKSRCKTVGDEFWRIQGCMFTNSNICLRFLSWRSGSKVDASCAVLVPNPPTLNQHNLRFAR